MDTNRQEDPLSSAVTQDDETQMTDDDQTQMSESDMTHNIRGRLRIESSSESEQADESSQQLDDLHPDLVNLGQEDAMSHTQESDSDSVEAENQIFDKPVTKAFETRQSGPNVHISDSDCPESGDDMSPTQSSQSVAFSDLTQPPVNQSSNMSKASGSKGSDVTESQRDQRQKKRKYKQTSISDTLKNTKKLGEQIKTNKSKGKPPHPKRQRKEQKNKSFVWDFAKKYADEDGATNIRCTLCGQRIGFLIGGCTSNIIRHIRNNHNNEYKKVQGKNSLDTDDVQPKIGNQLEKKTWK